MVRALVCGTRGCGFKSRQPPQESREMERRINKPKLNIKGDVAMNDVLRILAKYDRLPNNPYIPDGVWVEDILNKYGYLTLFVFVCPATRSKYLARDNKESFMPVREPENGLLFARIPKLKDLVTDLWSIGVASQVLFAVADNSYELYRGPVEGISLDIALMDERREKYLRDLKRRLSKPFPQLLDVVSLGLMRIGKSQENFEMPTDILNREIAFQKEIVYKRYYNNQPPKDAVIRRIAEGKIRAYAEQGLLIEAADALLIGTEGTDDIASWVQRTRMLQLSGAKFPSIYPYIRKEFL